MAEDWQGEERRSIPVHILNYIDASQERLQAHTDARFDILTKQVTSLTQSINSWMENEPAALLAKCETIMDEAFPTDAEDDDSTPRDRRKGHRIAHAKWMANVDEEMKQWKELRMKVIQWAVIGALGLTATAIWQYLLKGP